MNKIATILGEINEHKSYRAVFTVNKRWKPLLVIENIKKGYIYEVFLYETNNELYAERFVVSTKEGKIADVVKSLFLNFFNGYKFYNSSAIYTEALMLELEKITYKALQKQKNKEVK